MPARKQTGKRVTFDNLTAPFAECSERCNQLLSPDGIAIIVDAFHSIAGS